MKLNRHRHHIIIMLPDVSVSSKQLPQCLCAAVTSPTAGCNILYTVNLSIDM